MKTIINSEKVSVYEIKDTHAAVINKLGVIIALIDRSNKQIIWQHGIQQKTQDLFTQDLLTSLKGTKWDITDSGIDNFYADIEINPLLKNFSSHNRLP